MKDDIFIKQIVKLTIMIFLVILTSCGRRGVPLPPLTIVPEPIKNVRAIVRDEGVYILWTPPLKNNDGSPLENLMGFKVLKSERPPEGLCEKCMEIFEPISDVLYNLPAGAEGIVDDGVFKVFDNNLKYGYRYKYKVLSYTTSGYLSPDSKVVEILWDVSPSSPTNLKVEAGDRFVQLRWRAPVSLVDGQPLIGLAGFNIYRSRESHSYGMTPLNSEPVASNYYVDSGIENETKYYYVVRSVRRVDSSMIEGPASEEVMVVPRDMVPPQPPRGLVAIPEKDDIILRWDANTESDLKGYNIYRKESEGKKWRRLNREVLQGTTYRDDTVKRGITYFYYVTAIDNAPAENESEPSEKLKAFLR